MFDVVDGIDFKFFSRRRIPEIKAKDTIIVLRDIFNEVDNKCLLPLVFPIC